MPEEGAVGVIAAYVPTDFVFGTLPSGNVIRRTSSEIILSDGHVTTSIRGFDFTYSGVIVTDGVFTEFVVTYDAALAFEGYGFFSFAPSVVRELAQGDTAGLMSLILVGNDDIYGSAYRDILAGYSGDDRIAPNGGDDDVYGGTGFDTVYLSGSISDYAAENAGPGLFIVMDMNPLNGDEGIDFLYDVEAVAFLDGSSYALVEAPGGPDWAKQAGNVEIVAATYQFFTGSIPTADGFEYLIASPDNSQDLSDPYYANFNTENRYINFASNLGTDGAGRNFFNSEFGDLSFTGAVTAAYQEIVGKPLTGAALDFFVNAKGFYESIALARVVRPGVDLDDATKIVAIGSILNEAVKSGEGPYAEAITDLKYQVYADGQSTMLGSDLFALA